MTIAKVNIIKSLILVENFFGIYRNYHLLKGRVKCLVKIRIFADLCLILFPYASFLFAHYKFTNRIITSISDLFIAYYVSFQTANSISAITLSFIKSKCFKEFAVNIKMIQRLLENDPSYQVAIQNQAKRFLIHVAIFSVSMISMTLLYGYDTFTTEKPLVLTYLLKLSHHYRYFYEIFVFIELIEMIFVPLKFLNDSVTVATEKLSKANDETEKTEELWKMRGELEKWSESNQLLLAATNHLSDCFGAQMMLSLCSATLFYVILLYGGIEVMVSKVRKKDFSTYISIGYILLTLLSHLTIKLLVVISGQRTQNEVKKFSRNIANLHSILVGIPGAEAMWCERAAAGLARRLRAASLRVRLLSSLAVQMALLADILTLVVNYTIILLQFNHVV